MVVLRGSDRMYGRFFAGSAESGGIRIRERGNSTVVFVAGGGFVEGALSESGGESDQQAVGVTLGLLTAASLNAGDAGKEVARFRAISEELEEAPLLAGGLPMLEGV